MRRQRITHWDGSRPGKVCDQAGPIGGGGVGRRTSMMGESVLKMMSVS